MKKLIRNAVIAIVPALFAIVEGCNPSPPAYEAHCVLNGDAVQRIQNQDVLGHYDLLVVGEQSLRALEKRHRGKTLLRFNPWASSQYQRPPDGTQPGPGDIGMPELVMNYSGGRGLYCYVIDAGHADRFADWIESALSLNPDVRGIFIDDFGYHRRWWSGPDSIKAAAWGEDHETPEGLARLADMIRDCERLATAVVKSSLGDRGVMVVNGSARELATTLRYYEHAGAYPGGSNTWEDLLIEGACPWRYVHAGDLLGVAAFDSSGEMLPIGKTNLLRAIAAAKVRDLSVGLSWAEKPAHGGSCYQLPPGDWGDPRNWPGRK